MPIGIHFSAPVGDERTLLELAFELEQAQPWRRIQDLAPASDDVRKAAHATIRSASAG
jgi:hypothetical protein